MGHRTAVEAFSPQQRATGGERQIRGLEIDDDDALREVLCKVLAALGIETQGVDCQRGVDELIAQPINLRSLEPLVRNLYERLAATRSGTTPVADLWAYDAARWKLVAPNGRAVQLSLAESQLVRCLFERQGEVASREDLLTALDRPHLEAYSRNLDVTVSRLRKKVESLCRQKLPLTSARGRGYAFNAPAEIVG